MRMRRAAAAVLAFAGLSFAAFITLEISQGPANLAEARETVGPRLKAELAEAGLEFGQSIFVRIFKESHELELWARSGDGYRLFKTYPICAYSGDLGQKLKEGDHQSPEGFYVVTSSRMNPNSTYHLSFNLGFPNAFDRAHGRTGSYLMVHGGCLSVGCYAMTDAGIEEIYLLAEAAFANGHLSFPVHIFPFRMTNENIARHADLPWQEYWQNLKQGYDVFERAKLPPGANVEGGLYVFDLNGMRVAQ